MPGAARLGFVYSSILQTSLLLPVWHSARGRHDDLPPPDPLTATRYICLNWEFVTPERWATIFCQPARQVGERHSQASGPDRRQDRTSRAIAADASASLASASCPPAETALVTQWFR